MEIMLLAVGKTKTQWVVAGIQEYCKRLVNYIPFQFVELPDIKNSKSLSEQQQKQKEGEVILSRISASDHLILLDERGREYTSIELSGVMQKHMASGKKRLVFVIGGPYGFSPDVYSRADGKISLSKMTFNHEMVRVFFIEQLYRE